MTVFSQDGTPLTVMLNRSGQAGLVDLRQVAGEIARQRLSAKAGDVVDFDIDGLTFFAHAVCDDDGISLVALNHREQGTLLDSKGRLIISERGLGFAGVIRVADPTFNRARLLHVIAAYYGNRLEERARAKCHTNDALRALLDPVSQEDRLALGFERPRAYAVKADLRHLEDSITRLKRRAISPAVWSAFEAFPLDGDDEAQLSARQDRLARAFGIDVWNWKATATLARMRGLWKLISDDPFPRS